VSRTLAVDISRCTGCHTCELMCSFRHHGEFNLRHARIHTTVFLHDELAVPVVCSQCEEAWCEKICPTGAISSAATSGIDARVVRVDQAKCVGCRMCVQACPFGHMKIDDGGHAEKCDLCDGDPFCAQFCPRGALRYIDAEDAEEVKRQRIVEALADSYRGGE
jgi:anaerobic carbon-monoxide dehydrogenase iron sulfur subunit